MASDGAPEMMERSAREQRDRRKVFLHVVNRLLEDGYPSGLIARPRGTIW